MLRRLTYAIMKISPRFPSLIAHHVAMTSTVMNGALMIVITATMTMTIVTTMMCRRPRRWDGSNVTDLTTSSPLSSNLALNAITAHSSTSSSTAPTRFIRAQSTPCETTWVSQAPFRSRQRRSAQKITTTTRTVGLPTQEALSKMPRRPSILSLEVSLPLRTNMTRSINSIADPRYLPWLELPITFSRADQWAEIPYTGCFRLILDTIIHLVHFTKVLIDSGSALNIVFSSTLQELGLSKKDLNPVNSRFRGVILERAF